jgi:hypothetical protein
MKNLASIVTATNYLISNTVLIAKKHEILLGQELDDLDEHR